MNGRRAVRRPFINRERGVGGDSAATGMESYRFGRGRENDGSLPRGCGCLRFALGTALGRRCRRSDERLKVFVGVVVGTRCCRSARKMRVFMACSGGNALLAQSREVDGVRDAADGNGEVGVPAVSMARRRVDRLHGGQHCHRTMEIRSEVSAPVLMRPRSIGGIMEVVFPTAFWFGRGGYGRMLWAIRVAPAGFGRVPG